MYYKRIIKIIDTLTQISPQFVSVMDAYTQDPKTHKGFADAFETLKTNLQAKKAAKELLNKNYETVITAKPASNAPKYLFHYTVREKKEYNEAKEYFQRASK